MDEHTGCPGDLGTTVTAFCPTFHRAVELIGRRWTGVILRCLMSGATRFGDVTAAVPGLSDRLLSERLKELEAEGIVARTVFPTTPVRIEYRLTEKGAALNEVMLAISAWAEAWAAEPADGDTGSAAPVREPAGVGPAR